MTHHPVTFISLGPGDPESLTVKALRQLKSSDVVVVPGTASADGTMTSRAADILGYWAIPAELRLFPVPMERDRRKALSAYDAMCAELIQLYHEGRQVAVAVEGDISIYASIHYVLERLQAQKVPVVQLPGITSFIAAAAEASLSLVSRRERLLVVPIVQSAEELDRLLRESHTVVVMKLSQCQDVVKAFLQSHRDLLCHYFENIGTSSQFHTTDPAVVCQRSVPYFSLLIISSWSPVD